VWWVEGDAEPDLDVAAGDADVFDQQPQELLFLGGVELVDGAADPVGEVVHSAAELVAVRERGSFVGEAGAFGLQFAVSRGDLGGAALKFCQVDEPGLVEVDEAASFGFGGVDLAVQACQFGAQELVVGDRGGYRDGLFTGEELVWLGKCGSDVVEDELVEGGGAYVAFGAAALLPTGVAVGRGCGSSSSGARCRCGRASCGSWCRPRRRRI
jgi:hypothetical protein